MLGVCLRYTQNNYGSKLQAFATVRMLEELGIPFEIIRYNKKTWDFLLRSLARSCNGVFLQDRYCEIQRSFAFRRHPEVLEAVKVRREAFASFDRQFEKYLSREYPSYRALKNQCGNVYHQVMTCSDQLWSPAALGSGFYNLMFAPEQTGKISWASSFGVSQIPWYQRKRTKRYLQRIPCISMRENRGAQIVKALTGREVPVLMDPVFAFDKGSWNAMIPPAQPEWENYIFCYFLGRNPEHRAAAKELAEKTGKKIVTLRHLDEYVQEDENFGDFAPYDVDPVRFLNILRNADCVCTDSFHGAAFAILYEKQFLVFDRYRAGSANSKNSRIESLCQNLGLESRRFAGRDRIEQQMEAAIEYASVARRTGWYREQTIAYLKNALAL